MSFLRLGAIVGTLVFISVFFAGVSYAAVDETKAASIILFINFIIALTGFALGWILVVRFKNKLI